MNRRFATETWRAVKYLLICTVVSLLLTQLNLAATNAVLAAEGIQIGLALSVLSYAYTILNTGICTLLNRYFTFRATEKWYIALPLMLLVNFGWNWLGGAVTTLMGLSSSMTPTLALQRSMWMGLLWMVASYLLQRCAIYSHTTDTNAWYARMSKRHGMYTDENESGDDTDE